MKPMNSSSFYIKSMKNQLSDDKFLSNDPRKN